MAQYASTEHEEKRVCDLIEPLRPRAPARLPRGFRSLLSHCSGNHVRPPPRRVSAGLPTALLRANIAFHCYDLACEEGGDSHRISRVTMYPVE